MDESKLPPPCRSRLFHIKNFSRREILKSTYCHHSLQRRNDLSISPTTTFSSSHNSPPSSKYLPSPSSLSLPLSRILKIDSSGSPFRVSRQLSLVLVNLSHSPFPSLSPRSKLAQSRVNARAFRQPCCLTWERPEHSPLLCARALHSEYFTVLQLIPSYITIRFSFHFDSIFGKGERQIYLPFFYNNKRRWRVQSYLIFDIINLDGVSSVQIWKIRLRFGVINAPGFSIPVPKDRFVKGSRAFCHRADPPFCTRGTFPTYLYPSLPLSTHFSYRIRISRVRPALNLAPVMYRSPTACLPDSSRGGGEA